MTSLVIPFDAFKLIDLGQNVALRVYQELYNDHTEPVGVSATIQALGLIRPSDQVIDEFNRKWKLRSRRWTLHNTAIQFVTGKSTTSSELIKTRDGEVALMMLSFLTDSLKVEVVTKMIRTIIDTTPDSLIPVKPGRVQLTNVVSTVESQTSCISWTAEVTGAQSVLEEGPAHQAGGTVVPPYSFDIPAQCLAAYYQALCTVSRFSDYRCVLETEGSLALAFVLAYTICGLKVCAMVDDRVVFGDRAPSQHRVLLVRRRHPGHVSRVGLGRGIEDVQDILVADETGPLRANKVNVRGIGIASTIGIGLKQEEAKDLLAMAIGITMHTFAQGRRELVHYGDNDDTSIDYSGYSSDPELPEGAASRSVSWVPTKTRVTPDVVGLWLNCHVDEAIGLIGTSEEVLLLQNHKAPWKELKFSKMTAGVMAEFSLRDPGQQMEKRLRTNKPASKDDYVRLVHTLSAQLTLLCLLGFNTSSHANVRVRAGSQPQNTVIGKAMNCLEEPVAFGQEDALISWYQWIKGDRPREKDRIELLTSEGFLIYRRLLTDLSLAPEACEQVIVEPGHLAFGDYRPESIQASELGYFVTGRASYHKILEGPAKIRSSDKTRMVKMSWNIQETGNSLELGLSLECPAFQGSIETSVNQIAERSWCLRYGDKSLACTHDYDHVGLLLDGESVEEVGPGATETSEVPVAWRPIRLYRSHDNSLGQIACLLSIDGSRGEASVLARREACLRCCVTAAQKMGLACVID
jgi:hypothetical protein